MLHYAHKRTGRHFTGRAEKICPETKPYANLFYTVEFVCNGFICNVNSPITFILFGCDGIFYMHFNSLLMLIRQ